MSDVHESKSRFHVFSELNHIIKKTEFFAVITANDDEASRPWYQLSNSRLTQICQEVFARFGHPISRCSTYVRYYADEFQLNHDNPPESGELSFWRASPAFFFLIVILIRILLWENKRVEFESVFHLVMFTDPISSTRGNEMFNISTSILVSPRACDLCERAEKINMRKSTRVLTKRPSNDNDDAFKYFKHVFKIKMIPKSAEHEVQSARGVLEMN